MQSAMLSLQQVASVISEQILEQIALNMQVHLELLFLQKLLIELNLQDIQLQMFQCRSLAIAQSLQHVALKRSRHFLAHLVAPPFQSLQLRQMAWGLLAKAEASQQSRQLS
jgi:hypothetical protein